jgi:hypothetical protein
MLNRLHDSVWFIKYDVSEIVVLISVKFEPNFICDSDV